MIIKTQPRGPYFVGGWSFGAVLAFEVAVQLRILGEEVALLCMMDAAYPGEFDDSLHSEDTALVLSWTCCGRLECKYRTTPPGIGLSRSRAWRL